MGAKDEEQLRKLLVSRSLKPVSTLALQARAWGPGWGARAPPGGRVRASAGRAQGRARAKRAAPHAPPPPHARAAQMGLDVMCSAGAFTIGSGLGQAGLPGGIALQIVAYFGGACGVHTQGGRGVGAKGRPLLRADPPAAALCSHKPCAHKRTLSPRPRLLVRNPGPGRGGRAGRRRRRRAALPDGQRRDHGGGAAGAPKRPGGGGFVRG